MKNVFVQIFILLIIIFPSCEKKSGDPIAKKIDSLLKPWDHNSSPGAAVAVVKDGKVIFKKGYGMSNLEYNIPITPSSIFHIASESKQFTAFCIVLLAKEGKLNLDDDIRKHLTYVPDFGKTITIRQLIHHTSGIRDQWQLLSIGGQNLDDVIHQSNIIKLVEKQKDLNFDPGEQFLYCNTGYTLLAEIVKKVSGQSLREYADENIFKPLDMENTHFHDDNTEIVEGRTYSYDRNDKGKIVNSPLNYATIGATSLFTTVEDEVKWLNNYETGEVGGKEAIEQMHEQGVLNNGTKLNYAFAVTIDTLKGHRMIGHGGADAGYRTYAVRFPEERLGIIVFSNVGHFNPQDIANKIAALYLPDKSVDEKKPDFKPVSKSYKSYAGLYRSDESALEVVDSTDLYILYRDQHFRLNPLSDSSFSLWNGYAVVTFRRSGTDDINKFRFTTKQDERIFTRFVKPDLTDADRSKYVGTYESDELDARYQIVSKNGQLIIRHRKHPDGTLNVITRDQFSTPHWWMGNIIFNRDSGGSITGFEVNSDRVLHLKFTKI